MLETMFPSAAHRSELRTAVRNRYFYGKLLDVYHFELESNYLNGKRRLLNRLVSGYGVVCGLDVQRAPERGGIVVTRGLALDKWGNEIIVPAKTRPIPLPEDLVEDVLSKGQGHDEHEGEKKEPEAPAHEDTYQHDPSKPRDEDRVATVSICFHECEADPAPVLAGDCHTTDVCEAGVIREQYRIVITPGAAPPISTHCRVPDVVSGGRIDYAALARWVTEDCPRLQNDPCIPLANIRLSQKGDGCEIDDIDITIRPIVYTNDVLFDLILGLFHDSGEYRRGK